MILALSILFLVVLSMVVMLIRDALYWSLVDSATARIVIVDLVLSVVVLLFVTVSIIKS